MKKITFSLSYYNQKGALRAQILSWKSYSQELKANLTFCIIDDCSKVPAIEVLADMDLSDLDISIYRVQEDLYCNIGGVRNLGATVCKTDWMLILDTDTLVSEKLARAMIELSDKAGQCFKFNRTYQSNPNDPKHHKIHPGVCMIRIDDYWKVGGCDEDFVGHYGQTDCHFFYRAHNIINTVIMNNLFLEYNPDGESKIDRDLIHNQKLFESKKRANNWSTDFIRFDWKKEL